MTLSVVIPTYGREEVLCDTIRYLLALAAPADEIVVVDQTADHGLGTQDFLTQQSAAGAIRWLRHAPPGTVGAMNRGLLEARGELVLFLDDDIIPGAELVAAQRRAHAEHAEAWAVVGQVLQPEEWETAGTAKHAKGREGAGEPTEHTCPQCLRDEPKPKRCRRAEDTEVAAGRWTADGELTAKDAKGRETRQSGCPTGSAGLGKPSSTSPSIRVDSCDSRSGSLTGDLGFRFNGATPAWVTNVMAGNLCVKRERALAVGGFDANFTPPVAYRFETEFAKRVIAAGGRIWFEPTASIRHLRAARGGTRSQGSHLTSASPVHGVGDYYYALRCGRGWERVWYVARRPFREVRTRFHLRHPWYIPVKLIGEARAMLLALRLWRRGPKLLR